MSYFSDLALSRRSIRKYEEKGIAPSEIKELIKIAISAPSACNSQCWKFIAIIDKKVIKQIEEAVVNKFEEILSFSLNVLPENYIASKKKAVSFFSKAPVVIAVFMTQWEYFDPMFVSVLKKQDYSVQDITSLLGSPDLLSLGGAIQNLLLAAHEKGYGACWMNDPAIAGEEIGKILAVPKGHKFISLIPIGFPAYTPREKQMKSFDEIYSEI
jgi:nitroreductase